MDDTGFTGTVHLVFNGAKFLLGMAKELVSG
jgi:hypothetical protein